MSATAQARTSPTPPRLRAPSAKQALLMGLGALVAFFFMAPYIQMAITALTPGSELYSVPAQYLPSHFELSNLVTVWSEAPLWGYLRSSLVVAVFATLLALKILLALSVLGHFLFTMLLFASGRMTARRSRIIHISVFCHVVLIVLLAKGMFFISW